MSKDKAYLLPPDTLPLIQTLEEKSAELQSRLDPLQAKYTQDQERLTAKFLSEVQKIRREAALYRTDTMRALCRAVGAKWDDPDAFYTISVPAEKPVSYLMRKGSADVDDDEETDVIHLGGPKETPPTEVPPKSRMN